MLRYGLMMGTESHKKISLSFDRGTLLLSGLTRTQPPEHNGSRIWRWDTRIGAWRCDAIHYAAIYKSLAERFGVYFSDDVMKPAGVCWPQVVLPKLRPEQTEALAAFGR